MSIVDELNQRFDTLTDKKLKNNMTSWGVGLRNVEVRFILNTPEARQAFGKNSWILPPFVLKDRNSR